MNIWVASCHCTTEWLYKFQLSWNPVTLSEGLVNSNWNHTTEFSRAQHQTRLERNWFTSIPTQANAKGIRDALPRKVHKVTGSERHYTPKQVVRPNCVDFELINFSVTLATHSPPQNFWALIFIKKWLKSVIFRLVVDLKITTNREEILKICANFYKSLYTQTVPTPESTMKSSPDTEEIPEFTEEEVERAIKRMKRHKAQGVDGITSDIIKLGGPMVLTYLTNIFNNILRTKQIPDSWHEAKIVILFKKGDPKDIKNYRPISLLSHSYKIFTRLLQTRIERTLDENQPREQAGFRKGYSTTDHLQALNQIIEKSNEYNLPLCIGFINYEKAFDTVEHFAIFEALRKTNVNETYINILQNIYN